MKIIAQMDDISSIDIKTDSTFAILVAAQNNGHQIYYYTPQSLSLVDGKVIAQVHHLQLQENEFQHYKVLNSDYIDLTSADLILFRQDPPFDMNYITTSYLLEKIKDQILIINNPTSIRDCPEKIFITNFPDLTPPTIITADKNQLEVFYRQYHNIIIKPLYGCGGEGIFHIAPESDNLNVIYETMMKSYDCPFIAQKYLPEVKDGDKRILLLDGEPIGAVSRVAKSGEVRSNFHVGGVSKKADLTDFEMKACQKIAPELEKRGLVFAGIDVIGNYITEINVTSPTGIKEIDNLNKVKLEDLVVKSFERKINKSK